MTTPNQTAFRVVLDDETTALLMELSEACHCEPTVLLASLARDVLVDDALCHGQIHADPPEGLTKH